jgi:hypothetical protein
MAAVFAGTFMASCSAELPQWLTAPSGVAKQERALPEPRPFTNPVATAAAKDVLIQQFNTGRFKKEDPNFRFFAADPAHPEVSFGIVYNERGRVSELVIDAAVETRWSNLDEGRGKPAERVRFSLEPDPDSKESDPPKVIVQRILFSCTTGAGNILSAESSDMHFNPNCQTSQSSIEALEAGSVDNGPYRHAVEGLFAAVLPLDNSVLRDPQGFPIVKGFAAVDKAVKANDAAARAADVDTKFDRLVIGLLIFAGLFGTAALWGMRLSRRNAKLEKLLSDGLARRDQPRPTNRVGFTTKMLEVMGAPLIDGRRQLPLAVGHRIETIKVRIQQEEDRVWVYVQKILRNAGEDATCEIGDVLPQEKRARIATRKMEMAEQVLRDYDRLYRQYLEILLDTPKYNQVGRAYNLGLMGTYKANIEKGLTKLRDVLAPELNKMYFLSSRVRAVRELQYLRVDVRDDDIALPFFEAEEVDGVKNPRVLVFRREGSSFEERERYIPIPRSADWPENDHTGFKLTYDGQKVGILLNDRFRIAENAEGSTRPIASMVLIQRGGKTVEIPSVMTASEPLVFQEGDIVNIQGDHYQLHSARMRPKVGVMELEVGPVTKAAYLLERLPGIVQEKEGTALPVSPKAVNLAVSQRWWTLSGQLQKTPQGFPKKDEENKDIPSYDLGTAVVAAWKENDNGYPYDPTVDLPGLPPEGFLYDFLAVKLMSQNGGTFEEALQLLRSEDAAYQARRDMIAATVFSEQELTASPELQASIERDRVSIRKLREDLWFLHKDETVKTDIRDLLVFRYGALAGEGNKKVLDYLTDRVFQLWDQAKRPSDRSEHAIAEIPAEQFFDKATQRSVRAGDAKQFKEFEFDRRRLNQDRYYAELRDHFETKRKKG